MSFDALDMAVTYQNITNMKNPQASLRSATAAAEMEIESSLRVFADRLLQSRLPVSRQKSQMDAELFVESSKKTIKTCS